MTIAEKIARAKADYDEVYEAGKQAEYDKFWDAFQQNGTRTAYSNVFRGEGFDFSNFYPKYDIKPAGLSAQMFYAWEVRSRHNGSIAQRLKECGVVLDTSLATNLNSCFAYGRFTELPTIDCTGLSTSSPSSSVFQACYKDLQKIEKIISKEGITFTNWFNNTNLEEVAFEGVIGGSGLNLQWSTRLNKASIESLINTLSTTTSGLSVTLSKTAVNNAFAGGSTGDEWLNLIATKNNWTITIL